MTVTSLDQQHLHRTAELYRRDSQTTRQGAIHKVWRKGKEQKVRIRLGKKSDVFQSSGGGEDDQWLLSPWINADHEHGPVRRQQKFHEGQNVLINTIGGDFSNAIVQPMGENKKHPEPDHATDKHETMQYARQRRRIGPDFEEHWLAKDDKTYDDQSSSGSGGGSSGGQTLSGRLGAAAGGGGSSSSQDETDPDKLSVVLVRQGKKPDQDQQKQAWEGPSPSGGDPKPRHLTWAGEKGKTPDHKSDSIHTQYNDKTKTRMADGKIQHSVQGEAFSDDASAGNNAAQHTLTKDNVTGNVGQQSWHQIGASSIDTSTGDHYIVGTNSAWLHGSSAHIHGSPILTNQMVLHGGHTPPGKQSGRFNLLQRSLNAMRKLIGREPVLLGDDAYPGDDFYVENGAAITASYSSPTPPQATDPAFVGSGAPTNGFRWIDTNTGIEYSLYNGIWAEGGGKTVFPATPTLNQLFSIKILGIPVEQWVWNGTGWQHPRHLWMTDDDTQLYSDIDFRVPQLEVTGNATVDGNQHVIGNTIYDGTAEVQGHFAADSTSDFDDLATFHNGTHTTGGSTTTGGASIDNLTVTGTTAMTVDGGSF